MDEQVPGHGNRGDAISAALAERSGMHVATTPANVLDALRRQVASFDTAVMIVDTAGRIDIVNDQLVALIERPREAVEGVALSELFAGPALAGLNEKFRQASEGDAEPWFENFEARDAAGKSPHFRVKFSIVRQAAGSINILALVSRTDEVADKPSEAAQSSTEAVRAMVRAKAGSFTAGHLEMIGLDDVRTTLGPRWDKLAARVYDIADSILKSRLSKEDVFRRDANGNYVICFSSLCGEQAWFKAKALGQEIREALIGTEADDKLAEFKLDAETRERISGVRAETYDIALENDELAEIPDIMGLIKNKVDQATTKLRKQAATLLTELTEQCAVDFLLVKTLSGKTLPFKVAAYDVPTMMIAEKLRGIYSDSPKLLAQLDGLLLGATLERLYDMDPDTIPVCVVDVHFSTLSERSSSRAYFDLCRTAIGKPAKSLIFKVRDIPPELHHGRITEVLRMLANFSRFTSIQLRQPSLGNIDLAEAQVSIVTFGYSDFKAMYRHDPDALLRFVKLLRQYKVRIAVGNVSDSEGMDALDAIQPDYFSFAPMPSLGN